MDNEKPNYYSGERALRELASQTVAPGPVEPGLDCGDNSCMFRDRTQPSGMRTNGGCRCFERSLISALGAENASKVWRLREALRLSRERVAADRQRIIDLEAELAEGRGHVEALLNGPTTEQGRAAGLWLAGVEVDGD